MTKTAAQLMVEFGAQGADKVIADTKRVGGAVDDAGKKAGWFGTALGTAVGFGAIGLAANLGRAVAGIGKGLIGAAADAETMKMSLETAVGPRTEQVFKNLQKFAADTPFEFPELLQSTINLENFGITADKVIGETGRTWTQIIGDTASAMGKTYDQVTQAVLDASTGEYERLKELGVKATVEGDKVKFAYMKNGKQITAEADRNNSEMIQSTLAAIWNDKYQGAMDKQSRTFNGMLSTFRDNVKMTMQRSSGSVFGFAKDGLKHANLFFDRLNVGLDRGMGLFDATMRATKFTLQDVFGKTAGNIIFAGIDNMVSSITKGASVAKTFASGIFNVGGALTAAFFGADRKSFIQNLPSWARSTAQGLSTIAEAGGDLFRAFQSGGIGGMWDALMSGGEGRQILNATIGIAAHWGGVVWDNATDAASWVKNNLGDIASTGISATLSFVSKWGGILWGGALDATTWLKTNVPGIAATGIDATLSFVSKWGGIAWDKATDATSWVKTNIGGIAASGIDATLSFVSKWGGIAWGGATDAAAWVKTNVPGIASSGIDATVSFLATWGGMTWGTAKDAGEWIKTNVGPIAVTLTASVSVASVSAQDGEGAFGSGQESGKSLGERFTSGVSKGFEEVIGAFGIGSGGGGGGEGKEPAKPLSTVVEDWAIGFVAGLGQTFAHNFATNMKTLANPFIELPGIISNWFTTAVSPSFAGVEARNAILGDSGGTSPFDELSEIVSNSLFGELPDAGKSIANMDNPFGGMGDAIAGWIGTAWDSAAQSIKNALPAWAQYLIGGDFLAAFQALLGQSKGGGKGSTNFFGGSPSGLFNENGDQIFAPSVGVASAATPGTGPTPGQPSMPDVTPIGESLKRVMPGGLRDKVVIPAPDTSLFDKVMATIKRQMIDLGTSKAKIKLDADAAPAIRSLASTGKLIDAWNKLTATAKLDFDNGPAAIRYTDTFSLGTVFDKQTFTADLDFDNGQAAVAFTDAFGWGATFEAQTFTARLNFDTSALDAAISRVYMAMQTISDLLPRSPAKKGPMAREVKFDYIADSLASTMARMGPLTTNGMAGIAGTLSGPVLANRLPMSATYRGQQPVVQHIYQVLPEELEQLMRDAEKGGAFADAFPTALQGRRNKVGR